MAERRPGMHVPPRTMLVLRWFVGVGLILVALVYVDLSAVLARLGQVRWLLAFPAIVGLVAAHLLGAFTWMQLSRRLSGPVIDFGAAARTYYAAQTIGSMTPANIGADVYRVVAVARDGGGWRPTLAPIVIQRVSSYLSLIALGLAAAFLLPIPAQLVGMILVGSLCLAVVLGVTLLIAERGRRPDGFVARLRARLPFGLSGFEVSIARVWPAFAVGGSLALVFHVGAVLLSYVLVVAVTGDDVGAGATVVVASLAVSRLAIALPITVSGLGFQEVTLAALFPLIGLSAESALAVSLLNRLALVGTIIVGGAFLVIGGESRRMPSSAEREGVSS